MSIYKFDADSRAKRATARPYMMKVLLVGDASNYHNTLAKGLRALGHEVTLASAGGGWMRTAREIDISRPVKGKLGGLALWLNFQTRLKRLFSGYDAVSIATISFIELKPKRIRPVFDWLRKHNGAVFNTSLGTDPNYVRECLDPQSPIRYSEFSLFGEPSPLVKAEPNLISEWLSRDLSDLDMYIYNNVSGATSALWEYDVALHRVLPPGKIAYAGIPIDTASIPVVGIPDNVRKVRLFLGRHRDRMLVKGTDVIEAAARAVCERYPDRAELVIVENRPYAEYVELLESAHIVLDQLYSYTPATNALLAMAQGHCTLSGGAPEYYDFIGEREMRPVIHVEPDYQSVYSQLEQSVTHPADLRRRGLEGREFVVKHNDMKVVARRTADFWQRRLREEGRG